MLILPLISFIENLNYKKKSVFALMKIKYINNNNKKDLTYSIPLSPLPPPHKHVCLFNNDLLWRCHEAFL